MEHYIKKKGLVLIPIIKQTLNRWFLVILFCIVWQVASELKIWTNQILPSPIHSLVTALNLLVSGQLIADLLISVWRVLCGFSIAVILGVGLGGILGLFPRFKETVRSLVDLLRPIPPIAWIPLAILWFGIGDVSAIFIVSLGAFFPVFINTFDGVLNVPQSYNYVAYCLGAGRRLILTDILLPHAMPQILTGLRLGLGIAWTCVIAAEMMGSQSGLGYMIQLNRTLLQMDNVIVGMVVIGLTGLCFNKILYQAEKHYLRWKGDSF